jgi:hypothetical protein
MMPTLTTLGILLEYLVINPSKNPADIVKGMVLIHILSPVFMLFLKDCNLDSVPGNNIPNPRIKTRHRFYHYGKYLHTSMYPNSPYTFPKHSLLSEKCLK